MYLSESFCRFIKCVFITAFTISKCGTAFPYGLNAYDIGAKSALLKWRSTEKFSEEFKVHCSGIRHYITMNNDPHTDVDILTQYVPGAVNEVLIGNFKANYNYSCMISEQLPIGARVLGSRVSNPFHFATDFLEPEVPKTPEIIQQDNYPIGIHLFPVSTKFGPILGYKVQFHVSTGQAPDGSTLVIRDDKLVPFGEFSPANQDEAVISTAPISFQLTFQSGNLSPSISIDSSLLMGTLKKNAMYAVVTIAYSKSKRQIEVKSEDMLYSASKLSVPFIARGFTGFEPSAETTNSIRPSQIAVAISIGVILPLLIILYLISVGVYLICRARRIRDMQLRNSFTRDDIVDASQLRKCQHYDNAQPANETGNLPWLEPTFNVNNCTPSPTTEPGPSSRSGSTSRSQGNRSQSNPSNRSPSNPSNRIPSNPSNRIPSNPSNRIPSNPRNRIPSNPRNRSPSNPRNRSQSNPRNRSQSNPRNRSQSNPRAERFGSTLSTQGDILNFHSPKHKNQRSPSSFCHPLQTACSDSHTCNEHACKDTHSLPYVTTTDQSEENVSVRVKNNTSYQSTLSPTKFFSPLDFSSDLSFTKANLQLEHNDELILPRSSSSMFIPRGLSSGPLLTDPFDTHLSPIQVLLSELSVTGQSQQEDLAPDMEMDLFDITIN